MQVQRSLANNKVLIGELHKFQHELASKSAIGATCTGVTMEPGTPNDAVTLEFDVAPDETALDAAIAAYPSSPEPVASSFSSSVDTNYQLDHANIKVGDVIVFDVHMLCALGDVNNIQPDWVHCYPVVWRNATGNVQVKDDIMFDARGIPGLKVQMIGGADRVDFVVSMKKSGSFKLLNVDIHVKQRGTIL